MADILFSGCRSGKFPATYARRHLSDRIVVHAYDAYQARKIREDIWSNVRNVEVVCAPGLPEGTEYSEAFYYATNKLVSAELELDTLQDIHIHLAEGARLTTEGVDPATLSKLFSRVTGSRESRRAPIRCECFKKGALKRVRSFAAEFEASVPGGPRLRFTSLPGCFCHRRPDEGGVALAEVASRESIASGAISGRVAPVLDVGCGCGLVGMLVADALKRGGAAGAPLVLVDSHTRAIAAARMNASALGLDAECVLSDVGLAPDHPLRGKFAFALANPPYYGEGRIADLFAEIAAGSLAPGGICWMVAKSHEIIQDACTRFFASVESTKRRGYTIIRAVKSAC